MRWKRTPPFSIGMLRCTRLKTNQQLLLLRRVEKLIIDVNLQMVTHTCDCQNLLLHPDVSLHYRDQLVPRGSEHSVIGGDPPHKTACHNKQ